MAASVKGNFNGENVVVGCCTEIQCEGTFTDTPPNSGQVPWASSPETAGGARSLSPRPGRRRAAQGGKELWGDVGARIQF